MDEQNTGFWNRHSDHFLEMAFRWDKRERVEDPDGYGKRTGICGDTVEMYVTCEMGRIKWVTFHADGCMNTNACCNTVSLLAEGKSLEEAWEITPEDVIDYLETLPAEHTHCAELAVGAFYLALAKIKEDREDRYRSFRAKGK
ncbi:MAG: iron-sulfur cluster assembly scaffold protein [Deltaproteobacteria bacterium]|nr:iron-sulfur cluster assembly scaffold protein [Deltaproteobacteria bacterium]